MTNGYSYRISLIFQVECGHKFQAIVREVILHTVHGFIIPEEFSENPIEAKAFWTFLPRVIQSPSLRNNENRVGTEGVYLTFQRFKQEPNSR